MSAQPSNASNAKELVCELCRLFYRQGWVSGTGGGISIREGDRIVMAPSGVQKERLQPDDLFELDGAGQILKAPAGDAKLSACAPLFLHAFELRDAGAVIHSHSMNAMLATLVFGDELRVTHLEMMKGIRGTGYHDELVVPILENTAHECDLADAMADAMRRHPKTFAVLVRRHGVYVWGRDWVEAKTHAECYDYLFEAAVKMKQLGFDPSSAPARNPARNPE
jgi:methylthioribulose-1-phosphate dehydratase